MTTPNLDVVSEDRLQRLGADSDAIARHMETEAEWCRRMEDLLTRQMDPNRNFEDTVHNITLSIESGQQVSLKILEALQDLKSAKSTFTHRHSR